MRHGQTLHIVDRSSRTRAELARMSFALARHAEIYADVEELVLRPPSSGIVIVRDDVETGGPGKALQMLAKRGKWLPVIATGEQPRPSRVVSAMRHGALDYISLPLRQERLAQALDQITEEVATFGEARRRVVEARSRIANLTAREREVLDWLAEGRSNKMIARELGISPRTVEIHRANMMHKIGACHSAEAVRLRIEAQLAPPTATRVAEAPANETSPAPAGTLPPRAHIPITVEPVAS